MIAFLRLFSHSKNRFLLFFLFLPFTSYGSQQEVLFGSAKSDITGPPAERGMMGYANLKQTTAGIHTRLHARALVFKEKQENAKQLAIVVCDLGLISEAIKISVVQKLKEKKLNFSNDNVMIMATHTHSGPGGYFTTPLYNLTTLGFSEQNFNVIVQGIVKAIVQASSQLTEAHMFIEQGKLYNASFNRSLPAFIANAENKKESLSLEERDLLQDATNKTMTILKFVSTAGQELGLLNFFAVHNTSMPNTNHLISSDNKGILSYLFEKEKGPAFIAASANSEEGDVSPYDFESHESDTLTDVQKTFIHGTRQFEKAKELYQAAEKPLEGSLDYKHTWINMPGFEIKSDFTGQKNQQLCLGALGFSFAAGAEDGPSHIDGFYEGIKADDYTDKTWLDFANTFFINPFLTGGAEQKRCQYPKKILITTHSDMGNLITRTYPFQIFRIGSLAILGLPGEMTTMGGLRLRQRVRPILEKAGVDTIVIGGLANSYSGYITTQEEFKEQQYEGGHNEFGPFSHSAYMQIFSQLATALVFNQTVASAPEPDIRGSRINLRPGVIYDSEGSSHFGAMITKPKSSYQPGNTVSVEFVTGHPNNDLRTEDSFLEIQYLKNNVWQTIATDNDPETEYHWARNNRCLAACSTATIVWHIPPSQSKGNYRIAHKGNYKRFLSPEIKSFTGYSDVFMVQP